MAWFFRWCLSLGMGIPGLIAWLVGRASECELNWNDMMERKEWMNWLHRMEFPEGSYCLSLFMKAELLLCYEKDSRGILEG